MIDVEIIGWDEDFRYEEERRRVTEQISRIAEHNGFVYALVQDMMMKCRYRAGSVHVDVHFKRWDWVRSKSTRYIPARLYINEDCDLSDKNPNPEWFDEAE